jgi:hypothetical protein
MRYAGSCREGEPALHGDLGGRWVEHRARLHSGNYRGRWQGPPWRLLPSVVRAFFRTSGCQQLPGARFHGSPLASPAWAVLKHAGLLCLYTCSSCQGVYPGIATRCMGGHRRLMGTLAKGASPRMQRFCCWCGSRCGVGLRCGFWGCGGMDLPSSRQAVYHTPM